MPSSRRFFWLGGQCLAFVVVMLAGFVLLHRHNVETSRKIFATRMKLADSFGVRVSGVDQENFAVYFLDISDSELGERRLIDFLSRSAIGKIGTLKVSPVQSIDVAKLREHVAIGNVVTEPMKERVSEPQD